MSASVLPVFLKARDIPDVERNRPSVIEMCVAGERVGGRGSMIGAQQIGGLWRLYPTTREARTQLLLRGLAVRGAVLQLSSTNPYHIRDDSDEEKPSTKVWIDNLPISVADSEIEHSLVKLGCELRSSIRLERARDAGNKMTRFLTGRRFVFITVPTAPLEKTLKISMFTAKVYHREQKLSEKTVMCGNCLEEGHHRSMCERDIVCLACREPGHKRGDPRCQTTQAAPNRPSASGENENESARESADECEAERESVAVAESQKSGKVNGRESCRSNKSADTRGRATDRQTTLDASLQLRSPSHRRSSTPKRQRSGDGTGSGSGAATTKEKQRRVSTDQSGRHRHHKNDRTAGTDG